jgi:WD40 repeat protein
VIDHCDTKKYPEPLTTPTPPLAIRLTLFFYILFTLFSFFCRFISFSYDRYVKVWDTETGQCISRHTSKKVPFCAKIQPSPSLSHEFLVGQSDKKVVQWDTRANEIVQKYAPCFVPSP